MATDTNIDNWESHWDEYAESAKENPAQEYRRQLILDGFQNKNNPRVVDCGSGQGDLVHYLKGKLKNPQFFGLELSLSGIKCSQSKVPDAEFYQQDLLKTYEGPEQFKNWADYAVCSEVLEHIDEPHNVLKNIRPLLSEQGQLIVTVPGGPRTFFDKHIGHRKHYTKKELAQLLGDCGYEVVKCYASGFPFFNLYKIVVMARGKKILADISESEVKGSSGVSRLAHFVMRIFDGLFKLNFKNSLWGWQIYAIAKLKKD